jgi:hypothetical protein
VFFQFTVTTRRFRRGILRLEVVMKLLCLVALSTLVSGCAAASYQMGAAPGGQAAAPATSRQPLVRGYGGQSPIGRWDVVMKLEPGHAVQVLMADGGVVKGAVVGGTFTSLRVRAGAGERDLSASDVMRVDSMKAPGPGPLRKGAEGAAWGAGLVALLHVAVGASPQPRALAAGAALAAGQSILYERVGSEPVTIYVSPAMVPRARPAVK